MNREADGWGPSGSGSRGAGRRAGVGDALGRKLGRTRALGGWRARLGWLGREAEQAEAVCKASLFFFFFYFISLLLCLNSNLV